ncbi:MAG: ABC transporter ATP-binding protein [Minisyncoccia bacterium]
MIDVRDLKKEYVEEDTPTQALRGVTFSIDSGEFVSIMGPSGSGKSTLVQILSFLDRPTGGTYVFQGKEMEQMSDRELAHARNKEMGFVFQSFNLLSRLSVYENVELPLLYTDGASGKRRALIEAAIESAGLAEKMHTEAARLSGGQKQRVAIARALVNDPSVIFADEPTGNLDSASGLQIMDIFASLHARGRTVILVTHETQTAEFADRIITVKDGLLESDRPITARRDVGSPLK